MQRLRRVLTALSVLTISAAGLTWVLTPTQAAPIPPTSAVIRLQGNTFDPLAAAPAGSAAQRLGVQADHPTAYLVQFVGPVRDAWKAATEQAGASLYGYVPDFAFIARLEPSAVERVQGLPFVRWVGPYQPAYRLAPSLSATSPTASASGDAKPLTVTIQTLPDADLESLAEAVRAWGGTVQLVAATERAGYLRAVLDRDDLDEVAAQADVLWIEPYFKPELFNDVGGGSIMRADDVRADLGLYGSGQIVAVADSGLDLGTTDAAMSDDFEGRIVEGQAICANFEGGRTTWHDFNGHGTHVAGSVLGNGVLSGSDPANHDYAASFAGVAPEAQLVFQSLDHNANPGLECIPPDVLQYTFGPAYDQGARVHSHSWGGPTGGTSENPEYGGYTTAAQAVDEGTAAHQDMLVLYAAGNSGTDANANGVVDPDSMASPVRSSAYQLCS